MLRKDLNLEQHLKNEIKYFVTSVLLKLTILDSVIRLPNLKVQIATDDTHELKTQDHSTTLLNRRGKSVNNLQLGEYLTHTGK